MLTNNSNTRKLIYPEGFSLIGNTFGLIKNLSGYKKSHKLPDEINPATQSFVAKISTLEVREVADMLFSKMRAMLGYKRRDVSASYDLGLYVIETPDFTLNISIEIDPSCISRYMIVTELSSVVNPDIIVSEGFALAFDRCFEKVVIDFPCEVPVEDIIDRIEDYEDQTALTLEYPADASFCMVKLNAFAAFIRIDSSSLSLAFIDKQPVADIIDACNSMSCFFNRD